MTEFDTPFHVGDMRVGGTLVPTGTLSTFAPTEGGVISNTVVLEQRAGPVVIARDWTRANPKQEAGAWWNKQNTLTAGVTAEQKMIDRMGNAVLPLWNQMDVRTYAVLPRNKTVITGIGRRAGDYPGGYQQIFIHDMNEVTLNQWKF